MSASRMIPSTQIVVLILVVGSLVMGVIYFERVNLGLREGAMSLGVMEEAAPRTRTALRGLPCITENRENLLALQQVDQGALPNVEGDPEQDEAVEDEVYLGPRPDPHPRIEEITVEIEDGVGSARDQNNHYRGYYEDERQLEDFRFKETQPVEGARRPPALPWVGPH